jgi:hypothetical protein
MREKIMQALKQAGDSESKDGMDMVLIRIDKKRLRWNMQRLIIRFI